MLNVAATVTVAWLVVKSAVASSESSVTESIETIVTVGAVASPIIVKSLVAALVFPAESVSLTLSWYVVPSAILASKVQSVPETVAAPSELPPLKTSTVEPEVFVPLKVKLVSLVVSPEDKLPVTDPILSFAAVNIAVGAMVSIVIVLVISFAVAVPPLDCEMVITSEPSPIAVTSASTTKRFQYPKPSTVAVLPSVVNVIPLSKDNVIKSPTLP